MRISANVKHSQGADDDIRVRTDDISQALAIQSRPDGRGAAINGGELLMLALATCYCNDLHREAERLEIRIDSVEVEASADFHGVGLAATNIRYSAQVSSSADSERIDRLLRETDAVAEVHNTLRAMSSVTLVSPEQSRL